MLHTAPCDLRHLVVVLTWMKTRRLIASVGQFGFLPSLSGSAAVRQLVTD